MVNWGLRLRVWCLRSLERVAAVENLLASRSLVVLWNYLNTSQAAFSTGARRTQVPRTNGVGDATYRPTWREAGDRADEQENRTRSKVPSAYGKMSAACDVTQTLSPEHAGRLDKNYKSLTRQISISSRAS